jgi:hypothetical protein
MRYREGLTTRQSACMEAKRGTVVPGAASPARVMDMCDQSQAFEALQYVFYGLGAVSMGAGLVMLLSPSGNDQAKERAGSARIEPHVALEPGGGRVELSLSF